MSLLCACGFHKWVDLGKNILLTDTVEQCARCKKGRHFIAFGQAIQLYTPEAMREAWDQGKITNPEAHKKVYGY